MTPWQRWKRYGISVLLTTVLVMGLQPGGAGAAIASCLTLSGTMSSGDQEAVIGEPFTLAYQLTPGGSYTATVSRQPIDIVLVLDTSGSMGYYMDQKTQTETRMQVLKSASQTFINELKHINMSDRVGIVTFNTSAKKELDFTTNYDSVMSKINRLEPNGNTNLGSGLLLADSIFASSPAGRKKVVIALTDGLNTHYTKMNSKGKTEYVSNIDLAKAYAEEQANVLIGKGVPIYSIALGTPGQGNIDHALLELISKNSGARKYDASDASVLADVFKDITQVISLNGELKNIQIMQKLPGPGFEIDSSDTSGATIVGDTLIVNALPIAYPYAADPAQTVTVKLKQTSNIGSYTFEDADLYYTNACGGTDTGVIPNGMQVGIVGWVDVWGNVYVGDGSGKVTRYKLGDLSNPQWSIQEHASKVTNIGFEDSAEGDDDSKVIVTYENGANSEWDLRPVAPTLSVMDADGNPISGVGWNKGKAWIKVSGSGNQLPNSVHYLNHDFKPNPSGGTYIAGYEYRVNGGSWMAIAAGNPVQIAELGKDVTIEARAKTAAVSGDAAKPVSGVPALQSADLDNSAPTVRLDIIDPPAGSVDDTDPVIKVTASDPESGIQSVSVTIDGKTETKTFAGAAASVQPTWTLSEFFASKDDRAGWKKITLTVKNQANMTTVSFTEGAGAVLKTEHFQLVNPGPTGELNPSADYSVKASSTPVTVNVENVVKTIVPDRYADCATCDAVTVVSMEFKVNTTAWDGTVKSMPTWTKLGANQFKVVAEGTNKLYLKITDSTGKVHDTEAGGSPVTVKINYKQKRY